MGRMKQKILPKIEEQVFLDTYTTMDFLNRLTEYALNVFEWINLPEGVDARFIEKKLFETGRICFFKDKFLGFLCLPVNESGLQNVYGEFNRKNIYADNGFTRKRTLENSVVIYNNYLRTPTFTTINLYAIRLSRVQAIIDQNLNAQKTPILIVSPENQRLTMKQVYEQYEGDAPVIYGDSELAIDSIRVLKTDAPYVVDKLTLYKHELWNEVMTFLGINNANQDKKERLVESEVGANDEQIEQARYNMLDARRDACKKINEMFNLEIDCKFRNDDVQKAYELDKIAREFPTLIENDLIGGDIDE